ncbi:hypothetical protein A3G67_03120 [Candidatus Roizmanbacteria bacterium RIFCSPLOWO2_12_FULL_40_12]|uniref:Nucleotidyl transferase domain-containing protein n=1 Tax=Candidatus Roizmanbacteria bacterium RIFCSPLOWO2_01_FULL_40_42 TaxID=1802066 RepID=A0A1F7J5D4_9BACT|nr:MAG: hypothetical protein A2779_02755 [Candidatus Roizmanbacteria bacterium RIFCSPHIGHO2_01_FULL_40_98]OGK28263.1 MAG: hypothetical protein A3C31_00120 [Candidatus Roizmanbacteria bacterium RIFCSPHIGHO2_02_FULL_40_53]OGK30499.1 MAG: hypothetical protein A2W49_02805 [Candidatus Roizmanbacteria bacterium RIFCSPHIGHO2_12_41_18]OGK36913.1 MAG: hypothetical protein A3E69_00380 [Candidatus Roizmanbacteria bacterium RIFCSPHIGHO2_12_FULL_40_130]OGK50819.1 MAG: hypothetical protein A3B50_00890 [Candi
MKAIILASGKGTRLESLGDLPKALLTVSGKTLIERQLDSFLENKIHDVIITTGFKADELRSFIRGKSKYKDLHINYVFNQQYDKTNYIYSLWLAKKYIKNDDIILAHSDVIYDFSLFKRIVNTKKSHVTVSRKKNIRSKDLKAEVSNGKVIYIGLSPKGSNTFLCSSIFKLYKKDMDCWMSEIDSFIRKGVTDCYAEDAFNKVSAKMDLYPLYFETELGMDIDDQEDLITVRKLLEHE